MVDKYMHVCCISLQHPSLCSGWHGVPSRCVAQPPTTPGAADLWLLIRARLNSSTLWSVTLFLLCRAAVSRRGTCPVSPVWRAGLRRCVRSLLIGCCRLWYIAAANDPQTEGLVPFIYHS